MKTIKISEEIILKQIQLDDAQDIFNIIDTQREYLGKWLPFVEMTKKVGDTKAFIKSIIDTPDEQREFIFVIQYKNKTIGLAGFRDSDRLNKKTEIGYWLSENFQKKGIITQTVKSLIEFAFNEMQMNRIQIRCATGNLPSKKIPEKLGFKHEGVERAGELLSSGEFADLDVYSLLKEDYI